jgi:hypothetical protein
LVQVVAAQADTQGTAETGAAVTLQDLLLRLLEQLVLAVRGEAEDIQLFIFLQPQITLPLVAGEVALELVDPALLVLTGEIGQDQLHLITVALVALDRAVLASPTVGVGLVV